MKPQQLFSAAVVLVALLAGWFAPLQHSFDKRWVQMPAAMSWETISKARKAAAQPSFCMPYKCRVG